MTVDSHFKVWEGVYPSFKDAPAIGPGFEGPVWRDRSLEAAREALARLGTHEPLDYSLRQRNALLPPLSAAVLSAQPRLGVLDFGGGLGTGYIVLAKAMPQAVERIDYAVVEVDGICRAGGDLFKGRRGPDFRRESPTDRRFDIVQAASVIQYIEEWRRMVATLASCGARFMIFADMFIGPFASYVTLQNYYGSRIRHWLFNADEFVAEVERHGYALVSRTACDARILGQFGPLPMDALPSDLRIPNSFNLLFAKT